MKIHKYTVKVLLCIVFVLALLSFFGPISPWRCTAWANGPYTNNGDGTITDQSTGLMWQQSADEVLRDWPSAVDFCEVLEIEGYYDWRLPEKDELLGLIDTPCGIDPVFHGEIDVYWSITRIKGLRWAVTFSGCTYISASGKYTYYVRCVRDGGAPQPENPPNSNNQHVSGAVDGDYVRFGDRNWIMLDNTTGYVILKSYLDFEESGCDPNSAPFDEGNDQTWGWDDNEPASLNTYLNTNFYDALGKDKGFVDENGEWEIEEGVNNLAYTWVGKIALLTETEFYYYQENGPDLTGTMNKAIDYPGDDPNIDGNWWLLTPGVSDSEAIPGSAVMFVADGDSIAASDADNCTTNQFVRPTLHLKSGLFVAGGDGTREDPKIITDGSPPNQSTIAVPLDIKPQSCLNLINVKSKGVLRVAVLGTGTFDVTSLDPSSVLLEDVLPLRWALGDVSTASERVFGKEDTDQCRGYGPDGYEDLVLKFDTQEIVQALGNIEDGDEKLLTLTGTLHDGSRLRAEDVVTAEDVILIKESSNNKEKEKKK